MVAKPRPPAAVAQLPFRIVGRNPERAKATLALTCLGAVAHMVMCQHQALGGRFSKRAVAVFDSAHDLAPTKRLHYCSRFVQDKSRAKSTHEKSCTTCKFCTNVWPRGRQDRVASERAMSSLGRTALAKRIIETAQRDGMTVKTLRDDAIPSPLIETNACAGTPGRLCPLAAGLRCLEQGDAGTAIVEAAQAACFKGHEAHRPQHNLGTRSRSCWAGAGGCP